MFVVKRSSENPILSPNHRNKWEAAAAFNPSPMIRWHKQYLFYRAISERDPLAEPHEISTIGMATQDRKKNGWPLVDRKQFIAPEQDWEKFGCEDPRITQFEGKYYIFYTALSQYPFGPEGIKVAVAVSNSLSKVNQRHLVTPFNAKAMALFPERVKGKVAAIFSAHTDNPPAKMVIVTANEVSDLWHEKTWKNFEARLDDHAIDPRRNEYDHVEVGAAPVWTKHGWVLIYSHIQNYFPNPSGAQRVFGIEALLLDLQDPRKIIGRTMGPIITPEEHYEIVGEVPDIVFPSGAQLKGDTLEIFYGGADTTGAMAEVSLTDLVSSMRRDIRNDWQLKRYAGNPILKPIESNEWEAQGVLNPAAIQLGGKTHILYRSFSADNTSYVGYAISSDGFKIDYRHPEPIYSPRGEYELKRNGTGNSGCEDARVVKIANRLYITYTAFDGIGPPKVAVSSIAEKDFLNKKFNWTEPELLTPPNIDDKDSCIFPEKIGGKYFVLHRVGTDICGDFIDSLDFKKDKVKRCIRVMGPRHGMWDGVKIGIAGPPIKTKAGWLLLYHGISQADHGYRVGAALLDLKDPTYVIARSTDHILEAQEDYEKFGLVNNVVFPCGMVEKKGILYVYYGGADKVTGVATMKLDILLKALTR